MPLGGINAGWDEAVPADSENAGLGALRIRSLETTVQQVLDSEHNFPAAGGANTGYHRLGSARAFFDVESNVSSSGTDGRLYVASDTSRFFHVGSAGTMFLGAQGTIVAATAPGQNWYWALESGSVTPDSNGSATVAIPNSGYSGVPQVTVTAWKQAASPTNYRPFAWVSGNPTATSFGIGAWDNTSNSGASRCQVLWTSLGTRSL